MTFICIIPARSGSKRIKNKNTVKVKNKKLIQYTIDAALKVKKIKKVIITTNIKNLSKKRNKKLVIINRPNDLCKDNSTTESAILHVIKSKPKIFKKKINIVLLQPTSPMRDSKDIQSAIKSFETKKIDSLFSAYQDRIFFWKYKKLKFKSINYSYKNRMLSGYMKKKKKENISYIENGAIYIFKSKGFIKFNNRLFGKIGCSLMSKINSLEIDFKEDLKTFKAYKGEKF